MKNTAKKMRLKINVVEGTVVIGIFAGTMCIANLGYRAIGEMPLPAVMKIGCSIAWAYATVAFGWKAEFKGQELLKASKFYKKMKAKEDLLKKAEANGWTIVECKVDVEDWEAVVKAA